jgi:hypothetical protein
MVLKFANIGKQLRKNVNVGRVVLVKSGDQLDRSYQKLSIIWCQREERYLRRKANWIGHIMHSNRALKHIFKGEMDGAIEVTRRRRKRSEILLDDLNKTRGQWKMQEEALNSTLWRTGWGRDYEYVLGRTTERMLVHVLFFWNCISTKA